MKVISQTVCPVKVYDFETQVTRQKQSDFFLTCIQGSITVCRLCRRKKIIMCLHSYTASKNSKNAKPWCDKPLEYSLFVTPMDSDFFVSSSLLAPPEMYYLFFKHC